MKRILPFSLVVCGSILAYACSSSNSDPPPTNPTAEGGSSGSSGTSASSGTSGTSGGPDDSGADSPISPTGNPIEGIGAVTEVASQNGIFTDGPVWYKGALYFSTYGTTSTFLKLTPPNTATPVHPASAGATLQGSAFDPKALGFVSCEANIAGGGSIIRTPAEGGQGTAITLNYVDAGATVFNSPNDIAVRKDGTMFVTDPGYQDPTLLPTDFNHIWRIKPNGDIFETRVEGRPNGIALSVDEKTLFVSFTDPPAGAAPYILKYPLALADGAIGASSVFVSVGGTMGTTLLDGITVDSAGNVYAATKTGIEVYKPDGTKWGRIATTKQATSVGLGGADKKTLYITALTGMQQVTVKVPGK